MLRDRGTIMLCTSMNQALSLDDADQLIATGKRGPISHFKVHKVDEGNIRMFESLHYPGQFICMREGACSVQVRNPSQLLGYDTTVEPRLGVQ